MAKFKTGDNPADHTVREVVDYLKGDEATPDEHDRVMAAEREGSGRLGIINLTGAETSTVEAGEPAAGPNEAATGQYSPADRAKTVDDPHASGDAGVTAGEYPDDAPAQLGPDMPQSKAEEEAHAATLAAADAGQVSSLVDESAEPVRKTQTPEEALKLAAERAGQWKTAASNTPAEQ